MTSEILWQHECPGHIVTEVVDDEVWVSCYLEVVPPGPPRISEGLQVLYTFREGSGKTIHDVAQVGPALDLVAESEAALSWISGGGLSILSPTLIASTGPAQKVIDGARASNEITIEAWVKPTSTDYEGPARIITLSADFHHRHFQLAQAAALYDVRLRTTQTTANGRPSLSTPLELLRPELTHVVFTREAAGMARIYINGDPVIGKRIGGDFSNWEEEYSLALANEMIGDRAWLGEYHLVAVYSRALQAHEVSQNYQAGPHPT